MIFPSESLMASPIPVVPGLPFEARSKFSLRMLAGGGDHVDGEGEEGGPRAVFAVQVLSFETPNFPNIAALIVHSEVLLIPILGIDDFPDVVCKHFPSLRA